MTESSLKNQAMRCIDKIGSNSTMSTIMLDAWLSLERFLVQYGKLPPRLEDLDAAALASFVERQSSECVNVELLLMNLVGIRMILLESGCTMEQLAPLSVRVKRQRLANDKNGNYRFVKILAAAAR
ncbi:hypothetical protein [Paraburkholderia lacunae]|uniref:Integrase n=1 Tax=Paraburkholderia lacunae TaxID=2211104 RepID=A0A370MZB5_9BURK|nr:hypothetical protein [Paraburkholderia lacunae]RDJ98728.1 hypothetical protein DLM46_31840 [Paraburkholderia lacunae]